MLVSASQVHACNARQRARAHRASMQGCVIRGTKACVHTTIPTQGEHGAMGETRLESGRTNFGRNETDVFEIIGSAIGPLKEANIRLVRGRHAYGMWQACTWRMASMHMECGRDALGAWQACTCSKW